MESKIIGIISPNNKLCIKLPKIIQNNVQYSNRGELATLMNYDQLLDIGLKIGIDLSNENLRTDMINRIKNQLIQINCLFYEYKNNISIIKIDPLLFGDLLPILGMFSKGGSEFYIFISDLHLYNKPFAYLTFKQSPSRIGSKELIRIGNIINIDVSMEESCDNMAEKIKQKLIEINNTDEFYISVFNSQVCNKPFAYLTLKQSPSRIGVEELVKIGNMIGLDVSIETSCDNIATKIKQKIIEINNSK